MLKSNVKFWNNVIQTTRQQQQTQPLEEPLSPLSVASSSSSSFQSYYQTQATTLSPTHQKEDTDNDYQNEEEVDEIDELDEDDSMDDEQPHTGLKKKSIILRAVAGTTNSNNGNSRKRRGNLPKNVTAILKQWLIDHCRHPYPTEEEKRVLRLKTDLTLNQISNWFINARRRILPLILAAPIYRQQQPDDNNVSPASYKQKMRRKRGWIASSGKYHR